ncbi:Las1-domain-containing protein [Auriscalpium vulgare]|uniref:Las1-domain-containing protein n=1 Tax=Auriscalpium vulgare TaxID=40419 RepID=A0ACB8RVV8_9AGAM|nr:Las1-domain-containing protein [Auriscalpium vulgare]
MRLPRRTAWASLAELDQVCSWVYANEDDWHSKSLAVERLSAWKYITALPHALESLLALLTVTIQDHNQAQSSTSSLSLRHSYAAAIIRLVNGLVDPLQVGVYARSIASIAAQLNLPAWLVELRHAATHEDLPSLELLRAAAKESMNWLLHHYLLPTLNPPSDQPGPSTLRPLGPLLKQHKNIMKAITRDASLRSQYQGDIVRVMRDTERWISEAKVAANVTAGELAWDAAEDVDGDVAGEVDRKESWALERLSEELLAKGVLVPVAKKKRALDKGKMLPPPASLALWTPLLDNIVSHHPSFPSALASCIVSRLLSDRDDHSPGADQADITKPDSSYDICLASWVVWCVDERAHAGARKENIFLNLINGLGPRIVGAKDPRNAARMLLEALCTDDARLAEIASAVLSHPTLPSSDAGDWNEATMMVMEDRLQTVLSVQSDGGATTRSPASMEVTPSERGDTEGLPPGWRRLGEGSGWKPRPLGVFA